MEKDESKRVYLCRLAGFEEFTEYTAVDYKKAAAEFAKDMSSFLENEYPGKYWQEFTIETVCPKLEKAWRVKINLIHIWKN